MCSFAVLLRFSPALLLRLSLRFSLLRPRFQAAQLPGVFRLLPCCVSLPVSHASRPRFLPHSRAAFDPSLCVAALAFAARVLPCPSLAPRCLAFDVALLCWGWWVLGDAVRLVRFGASAGVARWWERWTWGWYGVAAARRGCAKRAGGLTKNIINRAYPPLPLAHRQGGVKLYATAGHAEASLGTRTRAHKPSNL